MSETMGHLSDPAGVPSTHELAVDPTDIDRVDTTAQPGSDDSL